MELYSFKNFIALLRVIYEWQLMNDMQDVEELSEVMCSSLVESYGWAFLPDLLLEEIFSQLPIKNLGRCSQVNCFLFF